MMPSTGLPSAWIDRLFDRFAALYGRHWFDAWADVPMADVKDSWQEAIGNASGEAIRRALEHCATHNKFPPTAPEFAELCREFRTPAVAVNALPAPKTSMPHAVAKAVENFGKPKGDPKKWARTILAEAEIGLYTLPIGIQFAREALELEGADADDMANRRSAPVETRCSTFLEVGGRNQKVELK